MAPRSSSNPVAPSWCRWPPAAVTTACRPPPTRSSCAARRAATCPGRSNRPRRPATVVPPCSATSPASRGSGPTIGWPSTRRQPRRPARRTYPTPSYPTAVVAAAAAGVTARPRCRPTATTRTVRWVEKSVSAYWFCIFFIFFFRNSFKITRLLYNIVLSKNSPPHPHQYATSVRSIWWCQILIDWISQPLFWRDAPIPSSLNLYRVHARACKAFVKKNQTYWLICRKGFSYFGQKCQQGDKIILMS